MQPAYPQIATRTLGSNGLLVSRLGLGLAALGRPGYINLGHAADLRGDYSVDAMCRHTHDMLSEAQRLGLRYFDTARSYGRAEEFLASWLTLHAGDPPLVVGSKWGYTYTAGWAVTADAHEIKDHALPTLERQLAESRALLGPWLRLYQIHSATEASGVLDRTEVLDRLARLKREDPPLRIGLTLSGPDTTRVLRHALEIERDGQRLFDTVQATFNILEPSLGQLLAAAHAAGQGIIVKEALANGRLTTRNTDADFAGQRALLEAEAARLGCALDQLALAFVLAQPWADCVLSGAATVAHLRSHAAASTLTLDQPAFASLATVAESPERYWQARAALVWN